MLKKIKPVYVAVVLFTTIFGSYGTFMYLKNNSKSSLLYKTSYYHLFFNYESSEKSYSQEDRMMNELVTGYTRKDLEKIRHRVWLMTFVSFIIGIGLAFLFHYLNERNEKLLAEAEDGEEKFPDSDIK